MIYFLVAFFATTLGAIAGLGGGLIIKPTLSLATPLGISNINLLSSITVFSMAVTSIIKRKRSNSIILINNFVFLIFGAILGGILGNIFFNHVIAVFDNQQSVENIQAIILIVLLSLVLFFRKLKIFLNLETKKSSLFLLGIFSAFIASFLSIGGGPLNVAVLILLFGVDIKTATFTSILIILTSQGSYIASSLVNGQFFSNNFYPALFMIPGGVLGGIVGTKINIHLEEKVVDKVFGTTLVFLIILNFFTIFI